MNLGKTFALLVILIANAAHGQLARLEGVKGESLKSVCTRIQSSKFAFGFVNEEQRIVEGIETRIPPENILTNDADEVELKTGFQLIVNRRMKEGFLIESPDLVYVKTQAICPKTTQYKVRVKQYVKSTQIGRSTFRTPIVIESLNDDGNRIESDVPVDIDVISPWIEFGQSESAANIKSASDFFAAKTNNLNLRLSNTGKSPLSIFGVAIKSATKAWFKLEAGDCLRPVEPGDGCNLVLQRISSDVPKEQGVDVFDIKSNMKIGYPKLTISWSPKNTTLQYSNLY